MERFSEENATWKVTDGFQLEVLPSGDSGALLSANQGTFAEESRFLRAEGGVVLIGEGQDTLHTELLFWSADSDRVHTPAPVESRTPQGILTAGTGLESDARFNRYPHFATHRPFFDGHHTTTNPMTAAQSSPDR